jgi:alpha-galactosidase
MIRRRDFVALGLGLVGEMAADGLTGNMRALGTNSESGSAQGLVIAGRRLSLRADRCEIPDWQMAIEVDGHLLSSSEAKVETIQESPLHFKLQFPNKPLEWEVRCESDAAEHLLLIRSTVRNKGQAPLALGRAFLMQADRVNGFATPDDTVVYLAMTSGQQLNEVKRLASKFTTNDIAVQMFNQSQHKALQVGFATFLRNKTQIEHRYDASSGLQLRAWCEFDGWELQTGAETPLEVFSLCTGDDPHRQLEQWAETAARICNIRPRIWETQPHGWLGWSWVDSFYVERYEDTVIRNAKSLQDRLAGFGIEYVWGSISNLKDGQPGDWLNWNYRYFPNGHEYLRSQLESFGLRWGLWCGAFMMSSKLESKVKDLWEALFKQPDGKQPVAYLPDWGYGLDSPTEDYRKPVYALDPSHPKTQVFLREVFQTYREWGVRYYMVDFLWAGSDTLSTIPHAKHYDRTLVSGPEVFRAGLQVIRDAAGDDTHLLGATGPSYHTTGLMDSMRVGNDFGEGRPIGIGFTTYPATYAVAPSTNWNGPYHALCNQAANYHTHRRLYINNSGNVLTVDKPLPLRVAQANATIHALSGGPSMLGDDITYIGEDRMSLIKATLPRPKDVATPIDLFTRNEQGCPRVYHRKVVQPYGRFDVVAVYNLGTGPTIQQEIALVELGLDGTKHYHAWEFWSSEYLGSNARSFSIEVPANSVKVIRLTEDNGQPVVIGTDMHILMGEVEIDRCQWDASTQVLSGRAIRPLNEKGSVFVYIPPKMGVADPKGDFIGKDIDRNCLIVRCLLRFDQGAADFKIKVYPLDVAAPETPTF